MLHPSELRCTLLSYASQNELRGPPIAASLISDPSDEIHRENKISRNKMLLFRPNFGAGRISFHWIIQWIYNFPREISHWTSKAKKYNVPCPHSYADPPSDINDTYVYKTPRNVPVCQKIRESIPLLI